MMQRPEAPSCFIPPLHTNFTTAPSYCAIFLPAAAVDNGLGLTPPMGWRSWNCFGGNVNQTMMTEIMDAMVASDRKVDGKQASLLSVGYNNAGLDGQYPCTTSVRRVDEGSILRG